MSPFALKFAFVVSVILVCFSFLLVVHSVYELKNFWYRNDEQAKGLLRQHGPYWVWHNYLQAEDSFNNNESVTITTHGTFVDLHLLSNLVDR